MLWEEIRASPLLCSYPDGSATVTSFVPFNSKPRGKSAAMKIYFTKLIGEFSSEIAEKVTSKRSSALGPHIPPRGRNEWEEEEQMEIHSEEVFNACSLFLARLLWCIFFFLSVGGHRWLNKWRKTFCGQLQENIAGSLPVMVSFLLENCTFDTISRHNIPLEFTEHFHPSADHEFNANSVYFLFLLLRLFKSAGCFSQSATALSNNPCLPFGVVKDKLSSNLCDFGTVSPEIHRTEPLSHKQAGVIIDSLHGGALIKITFLVTVQASRRLEMKIPGAGARLFPT